MRIDSTKHTEDGAVVLTTTLCSFALLSFLVIGYLWMMMQQGKSVDRSERWNTALVIAEAGIEEGMAHINYSFGTNVNLATNGWTYNSSKGYYGPRVRSLVDGSYSVTISGTTPPVVTSTATVTDEMNPVPIKRAVQVTTMPYMLNGPGIIVEGNATFSGNRPSLITSIGSINGSISVGNANVSGEAETGSSGSVTVGPQGFTQGTTNNFYMDMPDVTPPYNFGISPPSPNSNNVVVLAANTEYWVGGNYTSANTIYVAGTNVVLYVTGNFSVHMLSNAPNASLKLYVGSTNLSTSSTATFGGNSGDSINAPPGTAEQLFYFGLPNNTTITLKNGLTVMNAAIYAPEANFTQIGGQTVTGALVCNNYSANGLCVFNYDPRLAAAGIVTGYEVVSWKEIPPP